MAYRRSDRDLNYDNLPPQRWDSNRYHRESQYRGAPVIEQRPPYHDSRRGPVPVYEDERYYEEDRYGPGGFSERRYFEEEDYYDPRSRGGQMVPFRPERPSRPSAAPRPGMIRRQSSLDRVDFERRRSTRYEDYPPRGYDPRRASRYEDRRYDDVRIQDPDRYGDEGFREYREREWVRSRTRNDSPSPDRRSSVRDVKEEIREEKEIVVEKPYPRRGKTRMPKRLVHTKVLYDLGYPFYEEVCYQK